jgi:hypothetical protein
LPAVSEPRIPLAIYVPTLWRSSFASSLLEDHCYPFPHPSLMSNNVETYFVRGKAPVTAILDSLIIMHVGSTSKDEGLLLEARKRYVFAIASLRLDTSRKEPEMSLAGLLMVAMCILLNEVLSPSTCRGLMAIYPADHSSLVKIYSSASEGLHTSSWQCQVVGVSALVRARQDCYEDSAVEMRLLQWLQLVQVGFLVRTASLPLTDPKGTAPSCAMQPQTVSQTHRHRRHNFTLVRAGLAPSHRIRCCGSAGSRGHGRKLVSRRGKHQPPTRKPLHPREPAKRLAENAPSAPCNRRRHRYHLTDKPP